MRSKPKVAHEALAPEAAANEHAEGGMTQQTKGNVPSNMFPRRYLRMPEVIRMTGMSKSTVWEKSKNDPAFPKPVKVSDRCTAWRSDELMTWLDSRPLAIPCEG